MDMVPAAAWLADARAVSPSCLAASLSEDRRNGGGSRRGCPDVAQHVLPERHELGTGLDRPAAAIARQPAERGLDGGEDATRARRHDQDPGAEIAGFLDAVGD